MTFPLLCASFRNSMNIGVSTYLCLNHFYAPNWFHFPSVKRTMSPSPSQAARRGFPHCSINLGLPITRKIEERLPRWTFKLRPLVPPFEMSFVCTTWSVTSSWLHSCSYGNRADERRFGAGRVCVTYTHNISQRLIVAPSFLEPMTTFQWQ